MDRYGDAAVLIAVGIAGWALGMATMAVLGWLFGW